jgi:hypothetical protein
MWAASEWQKRATVSITSRATCWGASRPAWRTESGRMMPSSRAVWRAGMRGPLSRWAKRRPTARNASECAVAQVTEAGKERLASLAMALL